MKNQVKQGKCDCFVEGAVMLCKIHAAAPTLLEALKLLVWEGNVNRSVAGEDFNRAMIQAELAISKAEGGR